MILFQMLLDDECFMQRCGWNPVTGYEGLTERANLEMRRIGPACCFLGDEVMEKILAECTK